MRRAGHIFEQVVDFGSLRASAHRAAKGTRSRSSFEFRAELERNVLGLQRELCDGSYRPGIFHTFKIQDPKPRTISAAPFRDRVVHHSLCSAMEPTFERYSVFDSFACRTGKGNRAAVSRAQQHARRHPWFAKLDVERFFESLEHGILMGLLRRRFKDARALALVETILVAAANPQSTGLPIGNLTSQYFANFTLGAVDHYALEVVQVGAWVRYMDDMLLFGPDKRTVGKWAERIERYLEDALHLRSRRDAAVLAPVRVGIPFLGFRIWPSQIRLDGARVRRLRRRLRALNKKTPSTVDDDEFVSRSAASIVGWAEQADTMQLRRSFFRRLATQHG